VIFLSVGTQLPFERLVKTVDAWAAENTETKIFGQIGKTQYKPKHFSFSKRLTPRQYSEHINNCSIIVGHAGMGTIISGVDSGKPLVLMPRHESLGEHRNNHQIATADHFRRLGLVTIIEDKEEFDQAVKAILEQYKNAKPMAGQDDSSSISPQLIATISQFINRK